MLNLFKHTLTNLFADGKERIDVNRVRGSLERLEDRTMLSASHGMMAYNHAGQNSGSYGGAGTQKFSDSAAFASQQQQQRPVSYDSQSQAGSRELGQAYLEH